MNCTLVCQFVFVPENWSDKIISLFEVKTIFPLLARYLSWVLLRLSHMLQLNLLVPPPLICASWSANTITSVGLYFGNVINKANANEKPACVFLFMSKKNLPCYIILMMNRCPSVLLLLCGNKTPSNCCLSCTEGNQVQEGIAWNPYSLKPLLPSICTKV